MLILIIISLLYVNFDFHISSVLFCESHVICEGNDSLERARINEMQIFVGRLGRTC